MTENERKNAVTQAQLAHIGEGVLAYMREMDAEELQGKFPDIPDLAPGTKLWALFAADGRPIMLTDARSNAIASAYENELTTVSLH